MFRCGADINRITDLPHAGHTTFLSRSAIFLERSNTPQASHEYEKIAIVFLAFSGSPGLMYQDCLSIFQLSKAKLLFSTFLVGPLAFGVMSKSNMAVGICSETHALGISTTLLM